RALKIAGIYSICGFLWIILSDRLLAALIRDSEMLTRFQTYKGWVFILITAALVFILSRRALLETERLAISMKESEGRFRALFENVSVVALVVDPSDGSILDANEAAAAFYGWSREHLRSMRITQINTLTPEEVRIRMDEAKAGKQGLFRFKHRRADGSVRDVDVYTGPIQFSKKTALYSIIHDITERKLAKDALRESERRFRGAFENAMIGASLVDLTGRFIKVNQFLCAILGYSEEELLSKTFSDITHPDDVWIGLDYLKRLMAGEVEFASFEKRYIRKDGGVLYFIISPSLICDNGGEPQYFVTMFQDITERKRAEAMLRLSEERFRDLAESLPLTVFEMDLQERFTYVNRAGLEKFGYSQQEFNTGVVVEQVIAPQDLEHVRNIMARRLGGDLRGYVEYQGLRKDGTTFPITIASSPILRDGRPIGLRGIVMDLTERKELEEERLKFQKLESVGILAGGIAHDFNNLLQGIFGYISMAKMTIDRKEKSLAMLDQAEKALHQSVNLTTQLLTFSKGGKPVKQTTVLAPVIENAARFALSGSRIDYSVDIEERLLAVEADEGQIAQVLQNIVLNADQAMPMGGTVLITARNAHAPGPGVPIQLREGDYVMISIQDSGVGIPEQYLARIFDPYFTTKEKGSGLGLATSYSIIRNHDGMIDVRSEAGKGSTFTIYLPATAAVSQPVAPRPAAAQSLRRGKVLVMDDEDVVRMVAGELIDQLGHEAGFASDGESALKMCQTAKELGRPYDVVVLDLTIRGGMGGVETIKKLREIDPDVKAVVSSGYSDDDAVSEYRKHGFRAFLKKPYDLEELRTILNTLLI
ncbi:MAG TPA: PAS domain S-box protein, partial [Nitrospirota bacterium]|nr:PAS domain S-box protein [Nitrospirota bacterium]